MFSDEACSYPCQRFIKGGTDQNTGMIQCARCLMWFIDEEIEETDARPAR
jgi:hypothetical protein